MLSLSCKCRTIQINHGTIPPLNSIVKYTKNAITFLSFTLFTEITYARVVVKYKLKTVPTIVTVKVTRYPVTILVLFSIKKLYAAVVKFLGSRPAPYTIKSLSAVKEPDTTTIKGMRVNNATMVMIR